MNLIEDNGSSMYPLAYIAHNHGQETMIGKIELDGFDHLNWDPVDTKLYDGGKMFIEALLSKDYSFIGNTYFGLPTGEELINELSERKD